MNGLAPNCGIKWGQDETRLGRMCEIPILNKKYSSLKEQTFQACGGKLFNCLPKKTLKYAWVQNPRI